MININHFISDHVTNRQPSMFSDDKENNSTLLNLNNKKKYN